MPVCTKAVAILTIALLLAVVVVQAVPNEIAAPSTKVSLQQYAMKDGTYQGAAPAGLSATDGSSNLNQEDETGVNYINEQPVPPGALEAVMHGEDPEDANAATKYSSKTSKSQHTTNNKPQKGTFAEERQYAPQANDRPEQAQLPQQQQQQQQQQQFASPNQQQQRPPMQPVASDNDVFTALPQGMMMTKI